MMQFKLEPEISIEDYLEEQQPLETTDECIQPAVQDINQQPTDEMMAFKLEPEITLDGYGQQQQNPETTNESKQSAKQYLNPRQSSEKRIMSFIREENKSLRDEIANLTSTVTWLTETVVSLNGLLRKGKKSQDIERSEFNFPLRTEFDLSFIDKEIGETLIFKHECILEMRNLFSHKSLSKSLSSVMAVELILDFNVDGVHNKKGLRNYSFFFSALLEAIRQTDISLSPIKALQKAMHCVKNNACKRKSRSDQESKCKMLKTEN